MVDHRKQVEDYIENDLPLSNESSKISSMHSDVEADLELLKKRSPRMSQKSIETVLHQKHKKFSYSYPGLFFKTVRGEIDKTMLHSLLDLKASLDENKMSLDSARNRVIDCAKKDIDANKTTPRAKREKPPGTVVQELSFKCKPDES